ncbi:MAG: preprotein translocase subunit SecA [Parcubacteria group bacterium]|nr:preprotein translocase subunit SecA [Parcubacteria group bacterium]
MFWKRFWGGGPEKSALKLAPVVQKINTFEPTVQGLDDRALAEETVSFRTRLAAGEALDSLLPEAFAVVREAARRTLGQRHYDAQLMGGIVLHRGQIAEMRTGEGKTLAATLPVYLNALAGAGVHVVTVNDYLARRDAVWMGQIYSFLGLTVGVLNTDGSYRYDPEHKQSQNAKIKNQNEEDGLDKTRDTEGGFKVQHEFLRPCSKHEAYDADITYGTNNEFGFDYLRDNIAYRAEEVVQRAHAYAIVDEIDSILIDEARTPLIISAPSEEPEELYRTFARIAAALAEGGDYTVDEKLRAASLTDEGITKAEKMLGVENIYTEKGIKYVHHLENAVRARALFHKEKEYVVKNGEIVIVDEFTGRLQPGRRWSEGLHQAIEAKEGLKVQRESRTVASITFQNYFRLYGKLAGMTGTALTSQEEFHKVYNLDVVSVPTHRPMVRADRDDLIFQTERGKFEALARTVKELHERGQPVLVGTVSIEKNELVSERLRLTGIPHEVLNAKNHEREGEIIAQAGRKGAVTIATNMAGRGVDIILGGNPPNEREHEEVRSLGGLFVIGTERHEARRIDNQLRGRAGRQGDPGASQFYVSLEDSLMRVFAADMIKGMMGRFGIPEDQPIENKMITRALEQAQTKIEGFHFDARKHVLAFDDVLNHQRRLVYTLRRKLLLNEEGAVRSFLEEVYALYPAERETARKKEESFGEEQFLKIAGALILRSIDIHWMEHLEAMDYLRGSVNLRAYGQRDPLVEYKKEGVRLFKEMQESLRHHVAELLPNIREEMAKPAPEQKRAAENLATNRSDAPAASRPFAHKEKIGRNDPCPCGSGKKYKKCHGK